MADYRRREQDILELGRRVAWALDLENNLKHLEWINAWKRVQGRVQEGAEPARSG